MHDVQKIIFFFFIFQGYSGSTPPTSTATGPYPSGAPSKPMGGPAPPTSQSPRPGMPPNAYPYQGQRPPMYPGTKLCNRFNPFKRLNILKNLNKH